VLCVFFAVFWTLRLLVTTFVFDMRPYLTTRACRLGYQVLNIVFLYCRSFTASPLRSRILSPRLLRDQL
jgi:hypothetical protein